MLLLLISGPQQSGNDIDVFLAPLIEDLQSLWAVGVEAYNAYRKEFFNLRAILLWTINDYPAYGNLCGCMTNRYYACPVCGEDITPCRLSHSKKNAYMGHRSFLPKNQEFRFQKKAFNNEVEERDPPKLLTGHDVWEQDKGINNKWGKGTSKKQKSVDDNNTCNCWKKKSIFFYLQYWIYLLVRYQLDIMHIEKNVCESIYGTLWNIPGKTKENKRFCECLRSIKVLNGYSSNMKNLLSLKECKL